MAGQRLTTGSLVRSLTEALFADVRFATRTLRGMPSFTLAAVGTLAIGIGATTTIFSAVDGVLLKPLPYSTPERIVAVFQSDQAKHLDREDVAPANFEDWRRRTSSFAALAAGEPFSLAYQGPDGLEQLANWNVTRDFFSVLDAHPALGRLFVAADYEPGAGRVLVLTYASWQRRFGGDSTIVGRQLRIGRGTATVVGVLPKDFTYVGGPKIELYVPKVASPDEIRMRNAAWYHVVGRLKPSVSLEGARADINRVAAQLRVEYPATNQHTAVTVERLDTAIVGDVARELLLLFGAVGAVLLIACVNVANLVLARTARRTKEFAVRSALGAGRARLVTQLVTEHFLLALAGGAGGVALASWGIGVLRAAGPVSLPRLATLRVDSRALVFALGVVVLATFAFGILPAFRASGLSASSVLRSGDRAAGSVVRTRFRGALVAAEVALAVVLLVESSLLLRSFVSVMHADRGFTSERVLAATVFVFQSSPTAASRATFIARLVERAASVPGVESAGATSSLPLEAAIGADHGPFAISGRPATPGEEPSTRLAAVTPSAFGVLGIRLNRGRGFTAGDDASGAPVAVINESMARRHWPGEDPIGARVRVAFLGPSVEREIIGVVADTKQSALDAAVEPMLYMPHAQAPTGAMMLVVRTASEPRSVLRDFKRAIAEVDPSLPLAFVSTLDELAAASVRTRRFTLTLLSTFAVCALILALIGGCAVINQATAERQREIGVRIALGARPGDVLRMVVREGLAPAVVGMGFGIVGAGALTTVLRGMLFGVEALDPLTFVGVPALMLATATIACLIPARRATRIDPLQALRSS